jgi:hypothetical protein
MSDAPWTIATSTVISCLAAALAGIAMFFAKRYLDKVEKLDAEAVRKREIKELEERLEQVRREQHTENQRKLDSIQTSITGTNARLDQVMLEVMSRPGGGR